MKETHVYPTRRKLIQGFEESEEFRSGSGRYPFEYLKKDGDLIDEFSQRRLVNYGVASGRTNLPTASRGCFESWIVLVQETPIRVNGVTADSASLLLIPPFVEFESQDEGGCTYGIDTDGRSVQALIGKSALPPFVTGVSTDPQLGVRLRKLIRHELAGEQVEGEILAEIFAPFDVNAENLITTARERAACRARDAIDARLDSDVSLADICRDLGMSVRTVERAFRVRFQETMSSYIKRTRLEQARELLLSGMLVTEASLEVGWTHMGRFSVEFKKRFGESPSDTRKRHGSRFPAPLPVE